MATHDYNIANASGSAVRTDLNNVLAAIVSNNSNATEPATTFAYQYWADTTAGILKIRNAANDDWVNIMELDGTKLLLSGTAAAPALTFNTDLDTGIFKGGDDVLGFATGGSERVRIDADGRIGIGDQTLDDDLISARKASNVDLRFECTGDDLVNMFVDADRSAADTSLFSLKGLWNGTQVGQFRFETGPDITNKDDGGVAIYTAEAGVLERRFDQDYRGKVNFFTDTNYVIRSERSVASSAIFSINSAATDITDGTLEFVIRADGDVENTNGRISSLSDERFKENIVDANSQWDDIKAIQLRNFNFKESTGRPTHTQIGVIAQEIELVCPGVVKEVTNPDNEEETYKTVAHSIINMKALGALKEAMARIEELETKVAALEGGAE